MADEQSQLNLTKESSQEFSQQSSNETQTKNKSQAHELAKGHRDIGVAEFFARNRHLLGFDNKRKALMTTIKEAVDNSLDACEEAEILPEIIIEVIDMGDDRYRVVIEDNGPGILKKQVPKIFGKLLYGSKFHSLKQSRGQQGIGISASVMYGQMTTGKPTRIKSKIGKDYAPYYCELKINTQKNTPQIVKEEKIEWEKDHGTRIEIDLEASYIGGNQSIDEYLKQTAITNPHSTIIYTNPKAEQIIFPRATETKPDKPVEIKPHPYGIELGFLIDMLKTTKSKSLQNFLTTDFSRVGAGTAKTICENSSLLPNTKPSSMSRDMAEQLIKGIKKTKIISPPTDCIQPITSELLEKGLKKEINAEFYCASTRPPAVYRGNPFVVEAAIAYGGNIPGDNTVRLLRYANRVPLLYQQSAGAVNKAVLQTSWKNYGISQSRNALPVGPLVIAVHVASVWVPFTSESKEAIAQYPEIIKEMKLVIQECGRKLSSYVHKKKRVGDELKKRGMIEKYIPHLSEALIELLGLSNSEKELLGKNLEVILEKKRGKVEEIKFDASKNTEYDENFAKIGAKRNVEDDLFEEGDNHSSHKDNDNNTKQDNRENNKDDNVSTEDNNYNNTEDNDNKYNNNSDNDSKNDFPQDDVSKEDEE